MTSEAGARPVVGEPIGVGTVQQYGDADPALAPRHNSDVEWEKFAAERYWEHNYRALRKDDLAIINTVGAFFAESFRARGLRRLVPRANAWRRGIDVGSGPNLYPALTMLPWCRGITLTDISPSNVAWLAGELRRPPAAWRWGEFWDELRQYDGYRRLRRPAERLRRAATVAPTSVFDLPPDTYDVGTMFFVAESMTSYETEFEDATTRFLASLRPGSPFAAAFMDSSKGYEVAGESFPAVREVNERRVRETLDELGARAEVKKIDIPPQDPLRTGYDGMIIAVGTTRRI